MILLLDNYDSFTWNLAHLVGGLGRSVEVFRNDAINADAATDGRYEAILISPGPCTPDEAGASLDIAAQAVARRVPVFGVCLGHQALVQALGGHIVRAAAPMHGKISRIKHAGRGLFERTPQDFAAARYHSLIAEAASLPTSLVVIAEAEDGGEIMAVEHRTAPAAGVQFHPESIATEHGARLMSNFLAWSTARL